MALKSDANKNKGSNVKRGGTDPVEKKRRLETSRREEDDEDEEEQRPRGKALAKRDQKRTEVVVADDYSEDEGAGFDQMDTSHFSIPFIKVLQKTSPEVDEDDGAYIDGAKPGMFINSVTQELYPKGIEFIPVHSEHRFLEWVPRDQGGGLVGSLLPSDPIVVAARKGGGFGKLESPDGNDLIETFTLFGIMVDPDDDGTFEFAAQSFSSTGIGDYKKWMTMAKGVMVRGSDGRRVSLPLFAHIYDITTTKRENAKGSWQGRVVKFKGGKSESARLGTDHELYQAAKSLREMVMSGVATAKYETSDERTAGGRGGDDEDDSEW